MSTRMKPQPFASVDSLDDPGQFDGMSQPQMEDYFREYPGAAPGGTGETGLASNDAKGYSDLVQMRDRYLHMTNPNMVSRTIASAPNLGPSVADNPSWWTQRPLAASLNQEATDEDQMPASLRGLYRSAFIKQGKNG